MRTITISAPGKLMLLGEHAVVYSHPCLVTAVSQRILATVSETEEPTFSLEAPDVKLTGYKKSINDLGKGEIPKSAIFVEMAIKRFNEKYTVKGGLSVIMKSEFSSQFGFGSSSASIACMVKALAELTGKKFSNKELFDVAYKAVLDVQGKGSGFDVASAIFGGTLYFICGGKVIEKLNTGAVPLIVGYTGVKADTGSLIKQVAEKREKNKVKVDRIFQAIGKIVDEAKKKILDGDWERVGKLMDFNHEYLRNLGVSSEKLESLISAAKTAGAFGAKLSGAGGGDCMIALAPKEKILAVEDSISKAGGQVIHIKTNVPGASLENAQ